jgi:hypothetical protein
MLSCPSRSYRGRAQYGLKLARVAPAELPGKMFANMGADVLMIETSEPHRDASLEAQRREAFASTATSGASTSRFSTSVLSFNASARRFSRLRALAPSSFGDLRASGRLASSSPSRALPCDPSASPGLPQRSGRRQPRRRPPREQAEGAGAPAGQAARRQPCDRCRIGALPSRRRPGGTPQEPPLGTSRELMTLIISPRSAKYSRTTSPRHLPMEIPHAAASVLSR